MTLDELIRKLKSVARDEGGDIEVVGYSWIPERQTYYVANAVSVDVDPDDGGEPKVTLYFDPESEGA